MNPSTASGPILVVWNQKAGNAAGRQQINDELLSLERRGFDVEQHEPKSVEETIELANAAPDGAVVVAAGGDGTVHAVAQGLLERRMRDAASPDASPRGNPVLAILPMGTANDFFRSLGIPFDLRHAVAAIEQAILRRLDVVRVVIDGHNQWMINAATGGNAAEIVRRLNTQQKQQWGAWCYVPGVVAVAANLERFPIRVSLDDQRPIEFSSFNTIVANGRTAATLDVASRTNLEDGKVEAVVIKEGPLFETARVAADFVAGDYLENEQVFYRRAKTVRLECDRRIGFSIDGELHWGRSFEFIVHPGALPTFVGNEYPVELASSREPSTDTAIHRSP